MRSTNENLLLWEDRINERIRSGITIEEWCKKNEISKHKYHYWKHRISKKQKSDNEITFAEITPIVSKTENAVSNSAKADDFQLFYKSIQVTVPSNFNQDSLAGLMKVLQEL